MYSEELFALYEKKQTTGLTKEELERYEFLLGMSSFKKEFIENELEKKFQNK